MFGRRNPCSQNFPEIVTLQDGKTHLTISRKYFKAFRTYVEKEL